MNIRAVQALKQIGQGFIELSEALAAANEVGAPRPEKGSHISGDPVDDQDDEPFPQTEEEAEGPELKDIQEAAKKLIDTGRRDDFKKILTKFKASNLSAVDKADYPKLLAALQK